MPWAWRWCSRVAGCSVTELVWAKDQTSGPYRANMGHLEDVGMGYFAHLKTAWGMAFLLVSGGARLMIHGLLPFFDIEAGQQTVRKARRRMGYED